MHFYDTTMCTEILIPERKNFALNLPKCRLAVGANVQCIPIKHNHLNFEKLLLVFRYAKLSAM